ncbi:MAG: phosphate ABC transporter ATP-binding protein [Chloroflexi bacterium]|nr:phosphate ABC transporter ATP-binding protein [Chloroflexota bacterium]
MSIPVTAPSPYVYQINAIQQIYQRRTVLDLDELQIRQGEIFALVGPSGAGKSTLLRILAFLERPASGQVHVQVDGTNWMQDEIPIAQRRKIAMVFQRPALLSRPVRVNVAYGLRLRGNYDGKVRVEEALERVSLTHLADALPRTLSGGEMQRVAVARTLVLEPQILILDEPTANLDPTNVRIIEELVQDQNQRFGTSIVLVTHNIFQARRLADRVALIIDGKLVEVAATEDFFENPKDPRTAAFVSGDLIY